METKIYTILTWGIAVSLVLFLGTIVYFFFLQSVPADVDFIALQHFRFEVLKAIGIGFLIALLGLIVPHLLATARYNFDLEKEGRRLFSEAKTGIEYLPYELPGMEYEKAIAHLKAIHQTKHQADLYGNPLNPGKKYREEFNRTHAYEKIVAVRSALANMEYQKMDTEDQIKQLESCIEKASKRKDKKLLWKLPLLHSFIQRRPQGRFRS